MSDFINCNNNSLTPEQILAALLTQDTDGNVAIRTMEVDACAEDAVNCSNNAIPLEALIAKAIGITDCGKPALRLGSQKLFSSYLGYHSQSGTSAPVVKDINGAGIVAPIIDEIDGVWSYISAGTYRYTKTGAFAALAKVDVLISANANQASEVLVKPTVTANYIQFEVGNATSFSNNTLALNDDKLNLQRIEIRVYK